jgi:hypothetical protein
MTGMCEMIGLNDGAGLFRSGDSPNKCQIGHFSTIDSECHIGPFKNPGQLRSPHWSIQNPGQLCSPHFVISEHSAHHSSILTKDSTAALLTQHTCTPEQNLSAHSDHMVQIDHSYLFYSNCTPRGNKCLSWETSTFPVVQHSTDGISAKRCWGFKSMYWV